MRKMGMKMMIIRIKMLREARGPDVSEFNQRAHGPLYLSTGRGF